MVQYLLSIICETLGSYHCSGLGWGEYAIVPGTWESQDDCLSPGAHRHPGRHSSQTLSQRRKVKEGEREEEKEEEEAEEDHKNLTNSTLCRKGDIYLAPNSSSILCTALHVSFIPQ